MDLAILESEILILIFMSKIKKILIAGGAGFVGSHLCDYFVSKRHFVLAVDNLSTGNKQNIAHLSKFKNFKFVQLDILDKKVFGLGRFDEIFHLASPASPLSYQKMPIETWKANTLGTLNLLGFAKKNKSKFLFTSTSEVYGDPKVHPQKENYFGNVNPVGIRACYDESKRAGESLCMDYYRKYKMNIKIVRIFNTYGPKMDKDDGRVVSNFITQALLGKDLTVYGNGKQTRSFQYIDDLIAGLDKMMQSELRGPVNLGNPEEFTIIELAKRVLRLTGTKSRIIYKMATLDDPRQRKPNISLAKKALKWTPKIGLGVGLKITMDYYKNLLA